MEENAIYIVWDVKADSMNGIPSIVSIHKTQEAADASIPDDLRGLKRAPYGTDVANYIYLTIERRELLP